MDVLKGIQGMAQGAIDQAQGMAQGAIDQAKERYDAAREGKKLVDEGGPDVTQGILAKQAANDATNNDATIMKQMQSIIKSYEDACSQLTVLKQSTVAGSEELMALAESYSVRAKTLQRVLQEVSA